MSLINPRENKTFSKKPFWLGNKYVQRSTYRLVGWLFVWLHPRCLLGREEAVAIPQRRQGRFGQVQSESDGPAHAYQDGPWRPVSGQGSASRPGRSW